MVGKKLTMSDRSQLIVQSEIRNMTIECAKVKGINLAQGVCDLDLPGPVGQGAKQAIDDGINHYTRYDGLPVIRQAIARKFRDFNRLDIDPESEVIVTSGATGAFYSACLALVNPGDEVIVMEPYYGYHVNTILACAAQPVFLRLRPPHWEIDEEALRNLVTKRTKAIVVNTPMNPSGKVFTPAEIETLADFVLQNNLFLFSDEIYEYFVYDGLKHVSPFCVKRTRDRTVLIGGYSKTFAITGWRIGYAVSDARWAQTIGYVSDLVYVCAPAPLQVGVAQGIKELTEEYYENVATIYQQKRDRIVAALREGGLEPHVPQGAYYVLADVSHLPGKGSKAKALHILKKTGVAGVPGCAFYHDDGGEDLIRFCFAKRDDVLEDACRRLSALRA
jgi:aminotransferase